VAIKESDLQANSDLNQYIIHDLNQNPRLPFDNGQFNSVLCAFGIEYLIHPQEIFREVARVLKPGGKFLVSFSNRFYDKKVIALWDDIHEFERMGLVLEYFRQCGEFEDLYCESMKGLIRYNDDPFPAKNVYSCPMYILSGTKKG
jgi:ubiquinone/menaquinone biosynthesis C-methylase UbiE